MKIENIRNLLRQAAAMTYMEYFDDKFSIDTAREWADDQVNGLEDREVKSWFFSYEDGYFLSIYWDSNNDFPMLCLS